MAAQTNSGPAGLLQGLLQAKALENLRAAGGPPPEPGEAEKRGRQQGRGQRESFGSARFRKFFNGGSRVSEASGRKSANQFLAGG